MKDCIIVGGGMIGLMTAMELHHAGVDVLVIDKSTLGGESSWAGGGIISPLYPWRLDKSVNRLAAISQGIYPDLCNLITELTGIDTELLDSGLLTLDADQPALDWVSNNNINYLSVTRDELAQIEPALSGRYPGALFMPSVRQVRNPLLVKALRKALTSAGVEFMEHEEVRGFQVENDRVTGVALLRNKLSAKHVVVASGAWSARLLEQLGVDFNIEPVKGQMIMLRAKPGLLHRIILHDGHYVIPRKDGRVLCGSTLEHAGFDKTITADTRRELFDRAIKLVPKLKDAQIERHWAGLRPGTQRGIPYICAHPRLQNLYINAGHYRNGITLGPASAKLMADIVLDRKPTVDLSPYKVDVDH